MLKKIVLTVAPASAALVALPAAAQAQRGGYYDSRYEQSYRTDRYGSTYDRYGNRVYANNGYYGGNDAYYGRNTRYNDGYRTCSGTTGTIVGGIAGALLGREVTRSDGYYGRRNSGTTGAIVGGAVGALAGRAIDKSRCR